MDELKPSPEAAGDKSARQRTLAGSMWVTIPGTMLLLGAATLLLPPLAVADAPAARLAVALRWLPVALLPYAATCVLFAAARFIYWWGYLRRGHARPCAGCSDVVHAECRAAGDGAAAALTRTRLMRQMSPAGQGGIGPATI